MRPIPVLLMARELGSGGSERQLTEIARFLDRDRFEPHVGCFHAQGFRADELRAAGVPVVRFAVRSFYSPATLKPALEMGAYLRRHQIALVHTFDYPMNTFGIPVGRAFRVPVALSSQRCHRSLFPTLYRHVLRVTDAMVDGIVVNCEYVRRHLIEEERVGPGLIDLCYNGIDTEEFQAGGGGRAGEGITIGVVSVLRAEKSLHTLLDAFAMVRGLRPGTRLMVVGSGPLEGELRARAGKLGILPDCGWERDTAEVAAQLRAMDIFVLPSREEALSNSLMEAMACGCCAVASRVGGNPELVREGETGLLFRAGDAAELAGKLRMTIEQEGLRRSLGAGAARFIRREFSIQRAAARMGEIYARHLQDAPAA
jgi:glycosyltransferase involved in cell wall biosynthesis